MVGSSIADSGDSICGAVVDAPAFQNSSSPESASIALIGLASGVSGDARFTGAFLTLAKILGLPWGPILGLTPPEMIGSLDPPWESRRLPVDLEGDGEGIDGESGTERSHCCVSSVCFY